MLDCIKGTRFESKFKEKTKSGISEDIAIAQIINEEYNSIAEEVANIKGEQYSPTIIVSEELARTKEVTKEITKEEDIIEGVPLGQTHNEDGVLISDILSELLTAYVDIAKDPYILDINAVTQVANTILMMVRQGIGLRKIFYFINQPIIKDYLDRQSLSNSLSTDRYMSTDQLVKESLSRFGLSDVPLKTMIYHTEKSIEEGIEKPENRKGKIYPDFTIKELTENIENGGKDKKVQLKALDIFLEMQRQSKLFQKMIRSTSPDTQRFKSFTMLENQLELRKEVAETGVFKNYDKMFKNFIGEFFDVKLDYKLEISRYFLSQIPSYKAQLDDLKSQVNNVIADPVIEEKNILNIENDFVVFLLTETGTIQHDKYFKSLFQGDKSVPKLFKKLQNEYKREGNSNAFLEAMLPLINDRGQGYDSIKPKLKKATPIEKENIYSAYAELGNPEYREYFNKVLGLPAGSDFYKRMNLFFIMQTGTNNSPFNVVSYMPAQDYTSILKDTIIKASEGNIDISGFASIAALGDRVGLYVLNHLNNFYRNDKDQSFRVIYNKLNKTYSAIIGETDSRGRQIQVAGKGANNYLDYGPTILRINAPLDTKQDDGPPLNEDFYFQLTNDEVNEANPDLNKKLTQYLKDLGVNIKHVETIRDLEGNPINAYAKANLANQVIELVNGQIKESTLPEEAAHMITAMLGKNHPIIKQMMSNIVSYPVYEDVKAQYADVYTREDDFRFEAVGKLIAEHIIKKNALNQQQRTEVTNWWTRLLNVLRNFLSKFTFQNVKREMDIFEKVADDILNQRFNISELTHRGSEAYQLKSLSDIAISYNVNNSGFMPKAVNPDQIRIDLDRAGLKEVGISKSATGSYYFTRNGKKVNPVQSFYQLKDTLPQDQVNNKLTELQNSVKDEKFVTDEGQELYIKTTGEVIPQRVTGIVQDTLFAKNKTKAQKEKIEQALKSRFSKHFGTILHDLYENNVNYLLTTNKYSNLTGNPDKATNTIASHKDVSPDHAGQIAKGAVRLMDHISKQQAEIDPNGTAIIRTEQFISGTVNKKETGGTMDVVVTYSDGSMSLYDYKFINYKKEMIKDKWVIDSEQSLPFYKRRSYEEQIAIYKQMLKDMGVTKFRETRILPNNIQFRRKDKKLLNELRELKTFNMEDTYLMPVPVAKELTENKSLNNILKTLFKQSDMLSNLARQNYSDKKRLQEINLQQNLLSKTIQSIQVNHDVSPLVDSMRNLMENENKILKNITSLEDAKELYRLHEEMRALELLQSDILQSIKDKEIKAQVSFAFSNLSAIKSRIEDKITEILLDEHPEIDLPQREMGLFKANFGYLSKIAMPVFEVARKYVKQAFGDINRDVKDIIEEAKPRKAALEKWAKSNGMTLLQAYRRIINPETGNLIFTFSKEFYAEKSKAIEDENVKWFKDNYNYTEEGKAKFKEDFEEYKRQIELTVPEGKARENTISLWLAKNDLSKDSAWMNKYAVSKYAEVKTPDKWYSNEYRELLKPSNKELKEYYDWYVDINKKFNRLVPEKIGKSFVANIRKDVVDSIAQGSGIIDAGKEGFKDVVDGLRVRQNDIMQLEDGDAIPLLYYDNFLYKDKDGNWKQDPSKKNEDLTSNMILFAESVYRKHHMEKIASIMDLLKLHLSQQQVIKTDNFGKPIKDSTGEGYVLTESPTNVKTFEKLIKGLVYRQKMQNKDTFYEVGGKVLSVNKTIRSAMSYLSAKALSLNYVSAFGNLMGGYMNAYIKGVGGRYYTTKQMSKTQKMLVNRSDRDLYNHITEYFNVENENWIQKEAAKLSTSALTKNLTYDKIYILQQKGDEFIGNTVLVSMMQNYGLDENGNVKRLVDLPDGTKSILDRVKRENDKIQVEGMSNEAFDDFRNMVKYVSRQIKGTNTHEDINAMQTNLGGQILLQFRNWVTPMVEERFGNMQYTAEVKEWEYGRYKSLVKTVVNKRLIPNLMKMIVDIVTLGKIRFKADNDLLLQQYEQFIEANPLLEDKLTVQDYLDLRTRTLKESMVEARFITGFIVLLSAMAGDWDDDGQADYKKWFATRQLYKLMNRAYLELSFFSNPASLNALLKDPIPIFSVANDIIGLGTNTVDEAIDTIMFRSDEEEGDKKGKLHHLKKMVIGVRFLDQIMDDYEQTREKETSE